MLVVWDEPKRALNLESHGFDFADARDRFDWDRALVVPSRPGRDGRARFKALGDLDGRLVSLVFSFLGQEAIAAISLRPASRKERREYDESHT